MRTTLLLLVACAAPAPPPLVEGHDIKAPAADTHNVVAVPDADIAPNPADFLVTGPFRLPHTFEPTRYRARIAIRERDFSGHIEIEGQLTDSVSLIWLHGFGLVVTRAVATQNGIDVPLVFSGPRDDQLLGFESSQPLHTGPLTLSIDYRGAISDAMPTDPPSEPFVWTEGLFRRVIGASTYYFTQSEAIAARKIFPCIDEPDRKVPWQLSLEVPKDVVAASNAPIARETPIAGDRKLVEFDPTPPLPSYLVAFAVGPFEPVSVGKTKTGAPIRVLSLRGRTDHVKDAVRRTPQILDALETWLGVPYPYAKLDLVVVPRVGWAMENPGLITFEQALLEDPASTSVISHELAHQWFGDLVTLRWWDDIWLNESFATWMAQLMEERFAGISVDPIQQRERGFDRMGPAHARPHAVTTSSLTAGAFAPFKSIEKGVAAIDLLESFLGETRFRAAIQSYLRDHANGSVTTADLIAALDGAATLIDELLDRAVARSCRIRTDTHRCELAAPWVCEQLCEVVVVLVNEMVRDRASERNLGQDPIEPAVVGANDS